MNNFSDYTKYFETELNKFLSGYKENYLYEHLVYATEGGKHVRPLLAYLTAEAFGASKENVSSIAVAIELLHSYSLVHDDLPSMDNDEERRGKPTMHKKFGEGVAVLVGDGLLNLAYEELIQNIPTSKNSKILKGITAFAKFSGILGMVGGQYIDITSKASDKKSYLEMYAKKTSALMQAACVSSAYIAGARAKEVNAVSKYAYNLGVAFQLKDDLIGEKSEENNIITIIGKNKTKKLCEAYTQKSIASLNAIQNNHDLKKIANILLKREY